MAITFDGENLITEDSYKEPSSPRPAGEDIDLVRLYGRDVATYGGKTQDEFLALLERHKVGDTDARDALILAFAKLPFHFLKHRKFASLDASELISTVLVDVVEAVDEAPAKYDASKVSFATWVFTHVQRALLDAHARERSIVKVGGQARRRNRRIKRIQEQTKEPLTEKEIAEQTNIPINQVKSALLADPKDVSMNTPLTNKEGAEKLTVGDTIVDPKAKTAEQLLGTTEGRASIRTIFSEHLTPFQAQIMTLTFGLDSDTPDFWKFREDKEVRSLLPKGTGSNIAKTRATAIKKLANVEGLKQLLQSLVASDRVYGRGEIIAPHTDQFTTKDGKPVKGRKGQVPEETVRAMRKMRAEGATIQAVSDAFGVAYGSTYAILTGDYYKYIKDTNAA